MSGTTNEPRTMIKLTSLYINKDLKKPFQINFAEYKDGVYTGRYWEAIITGIQFFELLKPFLKEKGIEEAKA